MYLVRSHDSGIHESRRQTLQMKSISNSLLCIKCSLRCVYKRKHLILCFNIYVLCEKEHIHLFAANFLMYSRLLVVSQYGTPEGTVAVF